MKEMDDALINMKVDLFLKYLQSEKRYSNYTIISYKTDLKQFFDFISTKYNDISNDQEILTYQNFRSWIYYLNENSISSRSINRKLSAIKSYIKYLQRHHGFVGDPLSKVIKPKLKKRLPEFVNEESMISI